MARFFMFFSVSIYKCNNLIYMAILLPRLRHQHVRFGSVQFFDFEMMTMMMMLMVKSLNINPEWRIIH